MERELPEMERYRSVLVGYDGSENAERALGRAIILAKESSAKLRVLFVYTSLKFSSYPRPGLYRQFDEAAMMTAKAVTRSALDAAAAAGLKDAIAWYEDGIPADRLLTVADQEKVDLIVVGRRGVTGLQRVLMGSVSSAVVNHAKCDVLVVK